MRLGIDVDGVIAHFTRSYWLLCKQLFGKPKEFYEPEDWGFSNYNLTPEEIKTSWSALKAMPDYWMSMRVYDDANNLASLLRPQDTEFFITSRAKTEGHNLEFQTARWLRDRVGIDLPCVLVCDNKGEVARALRLDAFVDDRPENCDDVIKEHPSCRVFLLNRPWNQHYKGAERVNNIGEFIERSNG